jgi:hypothetical protein
LQNDEETLRTRVRDYWFAQADAAGRRGELAVVYRSLYNAGWDCGLHTLDEYGPLLDRLRQIAAQMGSPALAQLAQAHRQSLL